MAKTILILGATGTQGKFTPDNPAYLARLIPSGGSVAKLLLQYPQQYQVRCLTRNPDSDKARALAAQGAELIKADLTIPSTLPEAFRDVWGVFAVTDFYDTVGHFGSTSWIT